MPEKGWYIAPGLFHENSGQLCLFYSGLPLAPSTNIESFPHVPSVLQRMQTTGEGRHPKVERTDCFSSGSFLRRPALSPTFLWNSDLLRQESKHSEQPSLTKLQRLGNQRSAFHSWQPQKTRSGTQEIGGNNRIRNTALLPQQEPSQALAFEVWFYPLPAIAPCHTPKSQATSSVKSQCQHLRSNNSNQPLNCLQDGWHLN